MNLIYGRYMTTLHGNMVIIIQFTEVYFHESCQSQRTCSIYIACNSTFLLTFCCKTSFGNVARYLVHIKPQILTNIL
jgi:hypothetical protein